MAQGGVLPPSYEEEDKAAFIEINQHTLADRERIIGLTRAVRYIEQAGIPGDIVECGVWKGGSMMAVARTLLNLGSTERQVYLFDTFEGMTAPTDLDTDWYESTLHEMIHLYPGSRRVAS